VFPTIFSIGPFSLHTYGVMVAMAFLVGLRVTLLGARRRKIPEAFVMDWAIVVLLSGLVGARVLYVLLNAEYFRTHPLDVFKIWQGGLVFYGGFLAAAAAGVWYARQKMQPLSLLADIAAPALALGQALGRLGCFFAGCCYGKPTDGWMAVQFKHPDALAPLGIGLHPTQLYEAIGTFGIGVFLGWRLLMRKDQAGFLFWGYVLLYGLLRFVLEMLRGDVRGAVFGGMYPSQWIALLAIIFSASVLVSQIASAKGHK